MRSFSVVGARDVEGATGALVFIVGCEYSRIRAEIVSSNTLEGGRVSY